MKMRLYQEKDKQEMLALLREFLKERNHAFGAISTYFQTPKKNQKAYAEHFLKKFLATPRRRFLVAEEDSHIVGYILGHVEQSRYEKDHIRGKVDSFFVDDAFRGKQVGKQLYQTLENWFKKQHCKQIILLTATGSPASKIYTHWGFESVRVQMRKKL